LFWIFIGAIFIGALGLYTGGVLILFFPIAFIIAFSFPSFMWISYVYKKDIHEPEPRRIVMIALTFGFLSTILAIILSLPFILLFPSFVVSAVLVAPVVEEFCKASGLRLVKSEIHGEIDGVIYGVTIGMGFAMVENFLYELDFIFTDPAVWTFGSLLRGLGSTIGHGLGAGLIGYAYASYHLNKDQPGAFKNVILAYIAAVGLHALWNGVAVLSGENALGLVVIILIAVAEVVILKTLVSIARDKELQRRTVGLANEPAPGGGNVI
jgi:RsiW-degrading membrane proteinase PrsW (M82 family)